MLVVETRCTCPCEPSEHHKRGECMAWYGDKNTGFGCNCHATPDQCQITRLLAEIERLKKNCVCK